MARLFNVEVFNQVILGAASNPPKYVTKPEFNALLGSADVLVVTVMLDAVQANDTVVEVTWESSNVNEEAGFGGGPTFPVPPTGSADPADAPFSRGFSLSVFETTATTNGGGVTSTISAARIGAFGRFKVSSIPDMATVRLVVAGYG